MQSNDPKPSLAELSETQRAEAMARFAVLRPHLEQEVPLQRVAGDAGIPVRTARRWLARYRAAGLVGLARVARADVGKRKMPHEMVETIKGLFLRKPRPSAAAIHRRIIKLAKEHLWQPPSYSSVHAMVSALDPALVTLAHRGHAAYRDRFELIYRHRAERPNATWQADHTQLDILVLDANGQPKRPWLTTVIDDYSRIVAGYTVFLGAPSTLQTCLALRQAIWRKEDPAWPVCGIPEVLYVDHGCDFTSHHLEQVAADLKIQLVHSAVARPQGRGKVERLFGTLNTELLCELPGYLVEGKPATAPKLSLSALDAAIGAHIIGIYNVRKHQEIDAIPRVAWLGNGWVPRIPQSLESLDLLLIEVATARIVRRDGIHFEGLRYLDVTLAAYVGESVTVRYDPRDLAEIRVFHHNRFLCRAINQQHSDQTLSLKDIQTARVAHRRALRGEITERVSGRRDFWGSRNPVLPEPPMAAQPVPNPALRLYLEDG